MVARLPTRVSSAIAVVDKTLKRLLSNDGDKREEEHIIQADRAQGAALSAAMLADITEAHQYRQFRAIIPAIMAMTGISLLTHLMPQPVDVSDQEQTLRRIVILVHVGSLLIHASVSSIADDAKAHRLMVRVNEMNNAVGSFGCLSFLRWHSAYGTLAPSTLSAWSMAQEAALLAFAAWLMHMLVFPSGSRNRIYTCQIVALAFSPSYSQLPQPLQTLFFVLPIFVGEVLGRLCYRALLDVYIGQEVEKAKLREQAQDAMNHSYYIETARREELVKKKPPALPRRSPLRPRAASPMLDPGTLAPIRDEGMSSEADELDKDK